MRETGATGGDWRRLEETAPPIPSQQATRSTTRAPRAGPLHLRARRWHPPEAPGTPGSRAATPRAPHINFVWDVVICHGEHAHTTRASVTHPTHAQAGEVVRAQAALTSYYVSRLLRTICRSCAKAVRAGVIDSAPIRRMGYGEVTRSGDVLPLPGSSARHAAAPSLARRP